MQVRLHKQATTTPKIRAEIQAAPHSMTDQALADQYRVSVSTIRRWRFRDDVQDRSHTRHNLLATLTPVQEEVLIAARHFLLLRLGLDDLLAVAHEFLNPKLSRFALQRMLKRRQVPTVKELTQLEKATPCTTGKPFRLYPCRHQVSAADAR